MVDAKVDGEVDVKAVGARATVGVGGVGGTVVGMAVVCPCHDGAPVRVLRRLRHSETGIVDYSTQWSRPMSWEEMDAESRSTDKAVAVMYGCMECGVVKMLPVLMEARG